jgi:nitrate reductase NapD
MASVEVPAVLKNSVDLPTGKAVPSPENESGLARHYSGVLVVTRDDALSSCADAVNALDGAEVHMRHPETARLVAVLEGDSVDLHEDLLQRIRSIPGVLLASLVYHYVDENGSAVPGEKAAGGETT